MVNATISSLMAGLAGYLRGVRWMIGRPGLLMLSMLPFFMGIIGFAAGVTLFVQYGNSWLTSMLMGWFGGWQDDWLWVAFYWIVKSLMLVSLFLLFVLGSLVLVASIASPVNEYISVQVELELLGDSGAGTFTWRQWPRVMFGEFLKALAVISLPLVMLLIPGLNLLAGFVAAFLIGWDFYDFPLARRGWSFKERLSFVTKEFWTVLGFGLWLAIPFVHVFLVPLAVAGGTILNLEALARRGLVTLKSKSTTGQLQTSFT